MAFFYTLAAIFALQLANMQGWINAALTGAMIGLAAWTKNAALLSIPLLVLWLGYCLYRAWIFWRQAALALIACTVVAAPWYMRNLIGAGFIMPATAWTDQAERTLENALVFVTHPENFGVTGWLIVGAVIALVIRIIRYRDYYTYQPPAFIWFRSPSDEHRHRAAEQAAPGQLLLLLWTLPFFAAWWLFVSYDPRFLLLFLPLLCVLAGDWLARLWEERVNPAWQPRALIALALLVIVLAVPVLWQAVEFKSDLLRNPFMSDAEKRVLVGREPHP
jgi:hypothetical protein